MSGESFYKKLVNEMEKDGYELLEQGMILIFGGMFGGQAFQISQAGHPFRVEAFLFIFLVFSTVATVGVLHFLIAWMKVSDSASG